MQRLSPSPDEYMMSWTNPAEFDYLNITRIKLLNAGVSAKDLGFNEESLVPLLRAQKATDTYVKYLNLDGISLSDSKRLRDLCPKLKGFSDRVTPRYTTKIEEKTELNSQPGNWYLLQFKLPSGRLEERLIEV